MNLQEWIQYRRTCPLCEGILSTFLHSTKKQGIKIEDGRLLITFPMYEPNKQIKYIVGYSFDLQKNSFYIDFYDKNNVRLENETPTFLIEKFKKLNTNLGCYNFYRRCGTCERYYYTSTDFKLDLGSATLVSTLKSGSEEFGVSIEYFGFIQVIKEANEKPYRIFRLINFYPDQESSLTYWLDNDPGGTYPNYVIPINGEIITLPLIRFVSLEDTLSRLKKLLIFT